jgi:hypothetical protein
MRNLKIFVTDLKFYLTHIRADPKGFTQTYRYPERQVYSISPVDYKHGKPLGSLQR